MRAIGITRGGLSGAAEVERIERYCGLHRWQLTASELWPAGVPELGPLVTRVEETGAGCVLLPREVLSELEREYPHLWGTVRARLERRGVFTIAV